MAYYRYPVSGGEFVLLGSRYWQLTFNGVQIGGLYRTPQDALDAIGRRRQGHIPGAHLDGIIDPPPDLARWDTRSRVPADQVLPVS